MTDQVALDALLRTDFGTFARKVFHTLNPGSPFLLNWHIEAITHKLDQAQKGFEKRLILNMPPRSLKSMLASVALPAYILGRKPEARLICVSYAQPLSAKHSRD